MLTGVVNAPAELLNWAVKILLAANAVPEVENVTVTSLPIHKEVAQLTELIVCPVVADQLNNTKDNMTAILFTYYQVL